LFYKGSSLAPDGKISSIQGFFRQANRAKRVFRVPLVTVAEFRGLPTKAGSAREGLPVPLPPGSVPRA
jgi:hypothetical protein